MTAQLWPFGEWWAAKVRVALRTLRGPALYAELCHLLDLAGDRDVKAATLKPVVTRGDT